MYRCVVKFSNSGASAGIQKLCIVKILNQFIESTFWEATLEFFDNESIVSGEIRIALMIKVVSDLVRMLEINARKYIIWSAKLAGRIINTKL